MTIFYSFLFCGFICLLGQIILDNTKLTPGHITSLFVVIGAFLGMLGIYDKIIDVVGAGASIPIMSFGNTLFNGAYIGFKSGGFLGLFDTLLCKVSLGISSAIIFSFIFSCFTKVKD